MSANPIQIDPPIQYPNQWLPIEHLCTCGKRYRVDVELVKPPFAPQEYQHCGRDDVHYTPPGRIIATWEHDGEKWIPTGARR